MRKFFVSGLVIVALVALSAFALRSKALKSDKPPIKTQDTTVQIWNNTIDNRWINVPINISSLEGYNYRVTNTSGMTVKQFIIALYVYFQGKPHHGEGARRHQVNVRVMDKPLKPGEWTDINIAEELKGLSKSHHNELDTSLVEMWPKIIDLTNAGGQTRRWEMGKYHKPDASGNWVEDPKLNPKENRDVIVAASAAQGCYVYGSPIYAPCLNCNSGSLDCDSGTFCRIVKYNFKIDRGGVHKISTCYNCTLLNAAGQCDPLGTICAHGDGSPCVGSTEDLDPNNPC